MVTVEYNIWIFEHMPWRGIPVSNAGCIISFSLRVLYTEYQSAFTSFYSHQQRVMVVPSPHPLQHFSSFVLLIDHCHCVMTPVSVCRWCIENTKALAYVIWPVNLRLLKKVIFLLLRTKNFCEIGCEIQMMLPHGPFFLFSNIKRDVKNFSETHAQHTMRVF